MDQEGNPEEGGMGMEGGAETMPEKEEEEGGDMTDSANM